jgi:hypothetical protein
VVGAIVAGAASQAAAKPKPQRAPKSATRQRSRSTAQRTGTQRSGGTGNPSSIDGNATVQNASTKGMTQAGPAPKDPFAGASPAQQASGQQGR